MMANRIPNEKLEALIEQLSLRGIPGTDDPIEETYNDTFDALIELHAYRAAAPLEKVREWAKAFEEGRAVVLPCKVGDMVWGMEMTDRKLCGCPVDTIFISSGRISFDAIKGNGRREIMFAYDDIGKTVFLTREEAMAALEGREGQG